MFNRRNTATSWRFKVDGVNDIDNTVNLIFETVGRPVKNTSLFYTLNLLEANKVQRAKIDYNMLKNRLSDGLFYYGIYAITHELSNAGAYDLEVDGRTMSIYDILTSPDIDSSQVIRDNVRMYDLSNPRIADDILLDLTPDLFGKFTQPKQKYTRDDVTKTLLAVERNIGGVSQPYQYIQTMSELFSDDILFSDTMAGTYGGNAWGSICKHLLGKKTTPKAIWIDSSLGIEHNGNIWLDKIMLTDEEINKVLNMLGVTASEFMRDNGLKDEKEELSVMIYSNVFRELLDAKREGDIEGLFDIAVTFTDEILVNLNRLRRRV